MSKADDSTPALVEYRDVPGFPGYRVGDDGTVWSCWEKRTRPGRRGLFSVATDRWHPHSGYIDHRGYRITTIRHADGERRTVKFCRLVLLAFCGEPPPGHECCHENGDHADDRLENLRWGTHASNMADMRRHGRQVCGERCGNAKLTNESVLAIRALRQAGWTVTALARIFHTGHPQIVNVCNRKTWTHI
jgi:hypothetical protein